MPSDLLLQPHPLQLDARDGELVDREGGFTPRTGHGEAGRFEGVVADLPLDEQVAIALRIANFVASVVYDRPHQKVS